MNDFVELYKEREARINTFSIFDAFGYGDHRSLKKVIFRNKLKFEEKGTLISATTEAVNKTRGRPDSGFLLNERQFMLLVLLAKNTPESVDLKNKIENEFFRMRTVLANLASSRSSDEWKNLRKDGKAVYFQKTDVLKQFIDYATAQGSKNARHYYANVAKMENKALFVLEQKYSNVREFLNIKQLMQIATADQIIEKAFSEGMENGIQYKEIYKLAKDRIVQFSSIIGKSQVIELSSNKSIAIEFNDL